MGPDPEHDEGEKQMLLIENTEFATMRGMWNQVLDSLLRRMAEGGNSSGSVTLKLNIVLANTEVETAEGKRLAKHPIFDYKITSNMPQQFTYRNDILLGEVEMEYTEEGGIKLKRLPNSQMTLDDYERDEEDNT
jgi:hypothetical protein